MVFVKTLTLEQFAKGFKSINKIEEILNGDWSKLVTWSESWTVIGAPPDCSNGVFKHASCSGRYLRRSRDIIYRL